MRYSELSQFTYDELSILTWAQISQDAASLLVQYRNSDIALTPAVIGKLKAIAGEVDHSSTSALDKAKTVGEAISIILKILASLHTLGIDAQAAKDFVSRILESFSSLF